MKAHLRTFTFLMALLILPALACNMPSGAATQTAPAAEFTAAAGTVAAQLTRQAAGTDAAPAQTSTAPTTAPTTGVPDVTPSPTSSPTPPAGDPRQELGEPDWVDDFSGELRWPLYDDDHVTMEIVDQALEMTALNADGWESWMVAVPRLQDFYLEMTAEPEPCSGRDRFGLLFRAPEPNEGYLFGINCAGEYALRIWDGDEYTVIIDWTPSEHIRTEGENRIGVMARGASISLFANGNLLTRLTHTAYDRGAFGPFIGAANTGDFTVRITEIAFWELD